MSYEPRPKWQQIADDVRAAIDGGGLAPGDSLPSEMEIGAEWDVARGTVRRALLELEQAGLITPGRQRRVARHDRLTVHVTRTGDRLTRGEAATGGADSWLADMTTAGLHPTQKITVVAEHAPPGAVKRLGVPADETVVGRQLIRTAAGRPHNLITFWFPPAVAWGTPLAGPASITEGSVAWLETKYGPMEHEIEISARMPTPDEETALRIPAGVPVQVVWRASRTGDGTPLVASMAVYPGDRTVLRGSW